MFLNPVLMNDGVNTVFSGKFMPMISSLTAYEYDKSGHVTLKKSQSCMF